MKIDFRQSKARNLAVLPAQTRRAVRPRRSVFPSYGRLFSAFLSSATQEFGDLALRRGRHASVTSALQPSFFGVI